MFNQKQQLLQKYLCCILRYAKIKKKTLKENLIYDFLFLSSQPTLDITLLLGRRRGINPYPRGTG